MNLAEYQPLAARTAPMDVPVVVQQATFALGLVCEATEVLEVVDPAFGTEDPDLVKELGDVLWYTAGICTLFGLDLATIAPAVNLSCDVLANSPKIRISDLDKQVRVRILVVKAGIVSDYMKKVLGHGHELDVPRLTKGIEEVTDALYKTCLVHGVTLSDVAHTNIEKLKARYPEGFSSEASINRTA